MTTPKSSLRNRFPWERRRSSVGIKRWLLPARSRTKNSAESSPCVNDRRRCEPSDLRCQRGRPIEPEGEVLAGIGFVRTGNRRVPVECSSRIPPAPPGRACSGARYPPIQLSIRWLPGWIGRPRRSCIPVRATCRFCASCSRLWAPAEISHPTLIWPPWPSSAGRNCVPPIPALRDSVARGGATLCPEPGAFALSTEVPKYWLPGMDSNHVGTTFWKRGDLLIVRVSTSRGPSRRYPAAAFPDPG